MSSDNDSDNDEINFLDSLEPDPPKPTPAPFVVVAPAVAPVPARSHETRKLVAILLISAVCSGLAGGLVAWWLDQGDSPRPTANAVELGRTFVPKLANALADGFDAGAEAIQSGKTLGEGDALIKATFHKSRAKAFDDHAGKAIHDLVPDGQEFNDEATRTAMVNLFTGFAKGLREAK